MVMKMLKVYDIKYKQEYIREVAILTQKEWGKRNISKGGNLCILIKVNEIF